MQFEYKFLNSQADAIQRHKEVNEYLKIMFNVKYVFNYDIHALSTWFDRNELNFCKFNRELVHVGDIDGHKPDVRTDGKIRILSIGFESIVKYFDLSFKYVSGYNKTSPEHISEDGETFHDEKLNLCIYWFDETKKHMAENVKNKELTAKAWKHFEKEVKPLMSCKRLGEKFEVQEPIEDHFLCCMPPIYGKGCFYMSEPYSQTETGKYIYYKFTRAGSKYFIEFNTVN